MPDHRSTPDAGRSLSTTVSSLVSRLALLVVVAFVAATVIFFVSPDGTKAASKRNNNDKPAAAAADLTKLVSSTTKAKLPRAPRDPDPQGTTSGDVVHPKRVLPVYAEPGRRPFAKITPSQMGDTWLPVIERRDGFSRVLLPSKPNGSTGWLKNSGLETARTPYLVRVHVGSRELELFQDGALVGSWPVAVGAAGTPTPTGRTFLLGSIVDSNQSYSPVILPLGSHSDTLDTYGGGPGTVALHGWPDTSVFGQAVSHGCVRVPADALERLTQVPLGTLVIMDPQ